jgi:hypothetical protein
MIVLPSDITTSCFILTFTTDHHCCSTTKTLFTPSKALFDSSPRVHPPLTSIFCIATSSHPTRLTSTPNNYVHLAACTSRVPLFVQLLIFGSHGQQPPGVSFPANFLLREFHEWNFSEWLVNGVWIILCSSRVGHPGLAPPAALPSTRPRQSLVKYLRDHLHWHHLRRHQRRPSANLI